MPVVHDLAGVGQNFHDHFSTDITWQLNGAHSYDKYKKLRWKAVPRCSTRCSAPDRCRRTSSRAAPSGGVTGPRRRRICNSISSPAPGWRRASARCPAAMAPPATSIMCGRVRAASVQLRSANPADPPVIDPNSFAEPYDLDRHIDGIKIIQEIGRSRALCPLRRARAFPGRCLQYRADYEAVARANARSSYHPVGTCKMGLDALAVVDADLRCAASTPCACAIARSCRRSFRRIPTPRPWRSPKRPRTHPGQPVMPGTQLLRHRLGLSLAASRSRGLQRDE